MSSPSINPFARRESRSGRELATYRALTLVSWAVAVAVSVYYSVRAPAHGHRLGRQSGRHPTAFTPSMVLVYVYWGLLFASQSSYVAHLLAVQPAQTARVRSATAVASHFVAHNLLHSGWVLLFVTGHFVWAELVLLANFVNLTALYFRHAAAAAAAAPASTAPASTAPAATLHPALVHTPAVAGPLAWTFVALYWNGAILLPHADSLVLRILANVFVWGILAYGLFYLAVYGDYAMGFCLSLLAAALGTGQFLHHVFALQWIFAFTIMGLLFVATLALALPQWSGRPLPSVASLTRGDGERAPLLAEE